MLSGEKGTRICNMNDNVINKAHTLICISNILQQISVVSSCAALEKLASTKDFLQAQPSTQTVSR